MKIQVLGIEGNYETHEVKQREAIQKIRSLIGAELLDTVNLRNGKVMMVDDTGMIDGKPVNPEATKLYHAVCRPGTTHQIHGDVAIVTDADFV